MMNNRIISMTMIAVVALLSSCSSIVFETAQPSHEKELLSTTDELQGTWIGEEGDEIKIASRWIKTPDMKYKLGSDCVLKASNGRYFLSFESENGWQLVFAEVNGDKMVVSQFNVKSEREYNELAKYTSVTLLDAESEYDPRFLINPNVEEFERVLASDLKEELGVFTKK